MTKPPDLPCSITRDVGADLCLAADALADAVRLCVKLGRDTPHVPAWLTLRDLAIQASEAAFHVSDALSEAAGAELGHAGVHALDGGATAIVRRDADGVLRARLVVQERLAL